MVSVYEEFVQDLEMLPSSTSLQTTHKRSTDTTLQWGEICGVVQVCKACETLLPRVGSLCL
jgi:hypothetical protein